jgi:hypothetical protein
VVTHVQKITRPNVGTAWAWQPHAGGSGTDYDTHDEMMSHCLQPKRTLFTMLNHFCPTIHFILLYIKWECRNILNLRVKNWVRKRDYSCAPWWESKATENMPVLKVRTRNPPLLPVHSKAYQNMPRVVESSNGAPVTNELSIEDAIVTWLADFPPKNKLMCSDTHLFTT